MRRAGAAAAVLALGLIASAAKASDVQGWSRLAGKDEMTDAIAEGARFQKGDDRLVLFCRQEDGAKHFIVRWLTEYKLGRGGLREVVYRFDQQRPFTETWYYTPRNVESGLATLFMDPGRRFARRLLDSHASQMLFRIKSREGELHDIAVPLDDTARDLIRPALDTCS